MPPQAQTACTRIQYARAPDTVEDVLHTGATPADPFVRRGKAPLGHRVSVKVREIGEGLLRREEPECVLRCSVKRFDWTRRHVVATVVPTRVEVILSKTLFQRSIRAQSHSCTASKKKKS
jgi:hypothetical protein